MRGEYQSLSAARLMALLCNPQPKTRDLFHFISELAVNNFKKWRGISLIVINKIWHNVQISLIQIIQHCFARIVCVWILLASHLFELLPVDDSVPVLVKLPEGGHHLVLAGGLHLHLVSTYSHRLVPGLPVLYYTLLLCTVLYCTSLYCTVLYSNSLYCTVLYCTVVSRYSV